jgi:hypothetical protein
VAVGGKNKTASISYLESGHPKMSCSQTSHCNFLRRKSKLESDT